MAVLAFGCTPAHRQGAGVAVAGAGLVIVLAATAITSCDDPRPEPRPFAPPPEPRRCLTGFSRDDAQSGYVVGAVGATAILSGLALYAIGRVEEPRPPRYQRRPWRFKHRPPQTPRARPQTPEE
jgi:hypothetical protein